MTLPSLGSPQPGVASDEARSGWRAMCFVLRRRPTPGMRFLPATHGDSQVWPLTETPELTTRVTGELVISANSQHLYQVVTGFLLLQRASIVDVSLRFDKSYRPQLPSSHVAELRVNGGATI